MLFSKACLLGWMVAIPVGPVALLILQRRLKLGPLGGVASGIGAALADGLFGLLAAMGLSTLLGEVEVSRHFVRPLGSLALVLVGTYFFFQEPPPLEPEEVLSARYLHHYLWDALSTFLLTLTNPVTLIAFAALFAGSGLIPEDPRRIQYLEIAAGVGAGSFLWWSLVVVLAGPIRRNLSRQSEHRLLQIIGLVLIVIGLFSFIPRLGTLVDKLQTLGRMPW